MTKLAKDSKVVRIENAVQYDTHQFCTIVKNWYLNTAQTAINKGQSARSTLRFLVGSMVADKKEPQEIVRECRAFVAHAALVAVDTSIDSRTIVAGVAREFAALAPRSAQAMLSAAFREIGNFATAQRGDKAGEYCTSATKKMLQMRDDRAFARDAATAQAIANGKPTSGSITISTAADMAGLLARVKAGEKFVITYKVKG